MGHSRDGRGQLLIVALVGASCEGGSGSKYPEAVTPEPPFRPAIFEGGTNHGAGVGPGTVVTGDVDGDGLADVVTLSWTMEEVRVLLNKGRGVFAAPVTIWRGPSPEGLVLADLNNDDSPDLAVASGYGSGNVAILLNRGTGTFAPAVNYGTRQGTASIATGLIDGDDFADLVITNDPSTTNGVPSPGTVTVLLNQGNGTFGGPSVYDVGRSPRDAAIADLNGDGSNDVAVVNSADSHVSLLLNRGSSAFEDAVPIAADFDFTSISTNDFSEDGRPELVLGGRGIGVLFNVAGGRFGALQRYASGAEVRDIAIGDMNSDTLLDIAYITRGGLVSGVVRLGRSLLWEYDSYYFGAGGDIVSIAFGDFNRDGDADLVTANQATDDVTVFWSAGFDISVPGSLPARLTARSSLAVADLNVDGEPDWVMTSGTGELTVSFSDVRVLLPLPRPVPVDAGPDATFVATGDLNGDTRPDLAVVNGPQTGTVSILINELGSGLGPPVPVAAAARYGPTGGPQSAAIGDVNGDGMNDLVVANHAMSGAAGDISVLINLGGGAFAPPVEYVALPDLTNVPLADMDDAGVFMKDLNGDGNSDLVLGGWGANVLLNLGNGTFSPVAHYGKGTIGAAALAAGDVNADGHFDLVFAQADSIGVMLNDGAGIFRKPTRQSIARGARLALDDFDQDGDLDMAVTARHGAVGNLTVLANDGKGVFSVMVERAVGPTCCLIATKFTRDNLVDIAVGGTTTPSLLFLFRNLGQ